MEFENVFQESQHKKIITGIQQLYIIGLYDALPIEETLHIFMKYLPTALFHKLKRYVTSDPSNISSTIHWSTFKSKIDQLNMTYCSQELIALLSRLTTSENCVKTFHIYQNHQPTKSMEPNQSNTNRMVSR